MPPRENPPRIPPAFDDLRHLRRHTPRGWIIQHPLISQAPAPARPILHTRPPGYSTARELAESAGITLRHVHRICRNLQSQLCITPPHRRTLLFPTSAAAPLCQAAAARKKLPTTPPLGYITAAAARQQLGGISPSTLYRWTQQGRLSRIPGRSHTRPHILTHFYKLETIQACTTVPKQ